VAYAAEVLADSPSGYWRFEEGNPPFKDETAGNRNGTVRGSSLGSLTWREPGIANSKGLWFNNAIDNGGPYVGIAAGALNSPTSWTYELWFQPKNALSSGDTAVLLGVGGAGGTGETSRIGWFGFGGDAWISAFSPSGVNASTRSSVLEQTGKIKNKWYHVVAVFTTPATAIGIDVYINGALDNFQQTNMGTSGHPVPGSGEEIGLNVRGPAPGDAFAGYLDEVAVYPVALSAGRIAAHYNAAVADDTFAGNSHGGKRGKRALQTVGL
jgi:hypothetical protein